MVKSSFHEIDSPSIQTLKSIPVFLYFCGFMNRWSVSNIRPCHFMCKSFCRMARKIGILVFLLLLVFLGGFCQGHGEEVTQCIGGPFHKKQPSPEGADYVECLFWKSKACCTANFTAELKRNKVEVLYNFSWNHCKNLSKVSLIIKAVLLWYESVFY